MSFARGIGSSTQLGSRPGARVAGALEQERRSSRTGHLGAGTLACRHCDAPVSIGSGRLSPAETLTCPFCRLQAPLRDFLSLGLPTRPARVVVRVGPPATSG
jgi:hypothetical protein